jgi:hypothetical protein
MKAVTGTVFVETREEKRLMASLFAELAGVAKEFAVVAAPNGVVRSFRVVGGSVSTSKEPLVNPSGGQMTLVAAYEWVAASPKRVLVVLDWHVLANTPVHWRLVSDYLPRWQNPAGRHPGDPPSLVVFVGPALTLDSNNPLKGSLPILQFDLPSREDLRAVANGVAELPADAAGEALVDALCGLTADAAEQVCAETIARGKGWNLDSLLSGKRQALRESGVNLLPPVKQIGGLGRLTGFVHSELIPWLRDPMLAERRILLYGMMGCGKSLFARWLAGQLGCLVGETSMASLKAGIVGASEANLRRTLRIADEMGRHAPYIMLLDEIDTIPRDGLDGGTSSGMMQILLTTLNDWLSTGQNQVIVVATGNDLERLDPALESRFTSRWFVDLPTYTERREIAALHFSQYGCVNVDSAARLVAELTEGYSGREIGMDICRSAARLSNRKLDAYTVRQAVRRTTPVSVTQPEKLSKMRSSAASLRKANNEEDDSGDPSPTRRVVL